MKTFIISLMLVFVCIGGVAMAKTKVPCPRCSGSGMEIVWKTIEIPSMPIFIGMEGQERSIYNEPTKSLCATDKRKKCTLCDGKGVKNAGWNNTPGSIELPVENNPLVKMCQCDGEVYNDKDGNTWCKKCKGLIKDAGDDIETVIKKYNLYFKTVDADDIGVNKK